MQWGGGLAPSTASPLLCACCFVWGHGSGYLDVAAIGTSVRAFPEHRGAVVGLLKSLYGLASSLLVLFAAYWTSGTQLVGVLALLALALPLAGSVGLRATQGCFNGTSNSRVFERSHSCQEKSIHPTRP